MLVRLPLNKLNVVNALQLCQLTWPVVNENTVVQQIISHFSSTCPRLAGLEHCTNNHHMAREEACRRVSPRSRDIADPVTHPIRLGSRLLMGRNGESRSRRWRYRAEHIVRNISLILACCALGPPNRPKHIHHPSCWLPGTTDQSSPTELLNTSRWEKYTALYVKKAPTARQPSPSITRPAGCQVLLTNQAQQSYLTPKPIHHPSCWLPGSTDQSSPTELLNTSRWEKYMALYVKKASTARQPGTSITRPAGCQVLLTNQTQQKRPLISLTPVNEKMSRNATVMRYNIQHPSLPQYCNRETPCLATIRNGIGTQ
ncbi:hypothetical protein J6590_012408 [Homalodisca vitripennis]|nr:hypothetical protein J6590_012408 [Homalodisca vitripennis]